MTKDEVMNSIALKKRFCKDCNLSISVFDNPYFYERLQTLNILEDCIFKFNVFCNELEWFTDEQEYFKNYNKVKDSIIAFIKAVPEYNDFINTDYKYHPCVSKRNLYTEQNDGRSFISIDMKKANFSAMKYYSKNIFDNCETWEQFVSKFTLDQHIIHSKYIRQVILGACNPKCQIRYEQYLMNILCNHIISCLPDVSIFSLGEDEIIIEVSDSNINFSLAKLNKIVSSCQDGIGLLVRVESFKLNKIENGWIKSYNDDSHKIDFKCVDAEVYHQVIKHYFGIPITENDLVFYHNGRLAKFLNEVNNL